MSEEQKTIIETIRARRITTRKDAFYRASQIGVLRWMSGTWFPSEPKKQVDEFLEAWEAANKIVDGTQLVIDEAEMLGLNLPESAAREIERTAILAAEKAVREEIGRPLDEEAERDGDREPGQE